MDGGLYSIRMRIRWSASVVRVSLSPAVSIELMYGIPCVQKYKLAIHVRIFLKFYGTYIAGAVVGNDYVY